jgi:hypothetical protein
MNDPHQDRSQIRIALDFLRRLLERKPPHPDDPFAYRFAPVSRGPRCRSGAAVAGLPRGQAEDDSFRAYPLRRT